MLPWYEVGLKMSLLRLYTFFLLFISSDASHLIILCYFLTFCSCLLFLAVVCFVLNPLGFSLCHHQGVSSGGEREASHCLPV